MDALLDALTATRASPRSCSLAIARSIDLIVDATVVRSEIGYRVECRADLLAQICRGQLRHLRRVGDVVDVVCGPSSSAFEFPIYVEFLSSAGVATLCGSMRLHGETAHIDWFQVIVDKRRWWVPHTGAEKAVEVS